MNSEPNDPPETMRYQMIGEDTSTIAEKLAKYAGKASWEDLKVHLESGALIYVDASLDLTETAKAFATRKAVVARGIDNIKASKGEKTTDIEGLAMDEEYERETGGKVKLKKKRA